MSIHIWEDNIKLTPNELSVERMERNVCFNHPILYDIKDNIRGCFIQHNTFIKNTVQLCRLYIVKYKTVAVYTAQFQLIPNCTPLTILCNAIVTQLIWREKSSGC